MRRNENNFKRAMNELLNLDMSAGKSEQTEPEYTRKQEEVSQEVSRKVSQEVVDTTIFETPEVVPESQPTFSKPTWETVITPDVIIDGNITSGSNIKILGQVQGNISCEGTVTLSGNVNGDLYANSLKFQSGNVNGNVTIREDISADKDTVVKGDVSAENAIFNGYVEGNLLIQNVLELRETSAVIGNVKANGIAMYTGAKIRGMIDIGGNTEDMGNR